MNDPLLQVSGMKKTYGRFTALRDVTFSVRANELLGLIGPNGAGKTTVFECLAGVQPPDAVRVMFRNASLDPRKRSSALFYVPDAIAPWPEQPVRRALEFSLDFLGGRRNDYPTVLEQLGLNPLLQTPLGALSKGQRKRALLGLGLLAPQPILLIDEPFEGLDLRQTKQAMAALRQHVALGRTLFVSIHQIAEAARLCDRLILLNAGRTVAEGTAAELTALATQRSPGVSTADFEEVFLALT